MQLDVVKRRGVQAIVPDCSQSPCNGALAMQPSVTSWVQQIHFLHAIAADSYAGTQASAEALCMLLAGPGRWSTANADVS